MKKKDKHGQRLEEQALQPAEGQQNSQPQAEVKEQPTPAGEDLSALRAERDDLLARLQRLAADYQNYQKRVRKEIEQAREFANEQLIKSLLGVLDDMERALASAGAKHSQDDPLLEGMQLVHDKAMEALGAFGLQPIEAEGGLFDPDQHAALMQEPSDKHPPKTVLRELQKGYRLKGRTIRASSVVISQAPETQQADERAEEQPEEQ